MPVAVSDGKFYVPGGFLWAAHAGSLYDPTANQWTSLAAMPQGRHHAMSTGYDENRLRRAYYNDILGTQLIRLRSTIPRPTPDGADVHARDACRRRR
ncbi:MAG: kelch repeat-containing protein [Caldilineaceae bacterium]